MWTSAAIFTFTLIFFQFKFAIAPIGSNTLSKAMRNKLFEAELAIILKDQYPIQQAAGPVISPKEIEICRNLEFSSFRVRSGLKYYSEVKLRWRAANECCRLHGKVLMAEHNNQSLNDYKRKVDDGDPSTDFHNDDAAWTSASNIINARLFEWQSGEDFEPGIWGPNEPNNRDINGNPEGCGHLYYDKDQIVRMNDWSCFQQNRFFCEDEAPLTKEGADVANSELDICRDLSTHFTKFGTRYFHQKAAVRWKLADKCCKLHGMQLISLDDETDDEYEILRQNIHMSDEDFYLTWTSGNDLDRLMDFKWQTGESIYKNGNYSREKKFCFFENYPQNYHPNRHCIQVRFYSNVTTKGEPEEGLRLRNVQCGLLRDFICEQPRPPTTTTPLPPVQQSATPSKENPLMGSNSNEPKRLDLTALKTLIRDMTGSKLPNSVALPENLPILRNPDVLPKSESKTLPPVKLPIVPESRVKSRIPASSDSNCPNPNRLVERGKPAFILQSPAFLTGQYSPGLNCKYEFEAGPACTIELTCDEIDIRDACTEDNLSVSDGVASPNRSICHNPKDTMGITSNLVSFECLKLLVSFTSSKSPDFDRRYNGFNCLVKCVEDKQIISKSTQAPKKKSHTKRPEYTPPYLDGYPLTDHAVQDEGESKLLDVEQQDCGSEYYRAHKRIRQKEYPSKEEYDKTCPQQSEKPCPPNQVPKELAADIGFQNRKLLKAFVTRAISKTCVPEHHPKLGFKLYDLIVAIYIKICPLIPARFLDNARFLFKVLHYVSSEGRTELISAENFHSVHAILHHCKDDAQAHLGYMDRCHERILSFDQVDKYICTKPRHEFNIRRNDPLVDIFWKIYEAIHAKCFPYFKKKRRMFHQFSVTIMDLISTAIKQRWNKASGSHTFWQKLLGPHYWIVLENIEKCTQHIVLSSALPYRLERETLPQSVRMVGETGS